MKSKRAEKDFPVVRVGGSAGGLDAYIRLLRHLPVDRDYQARPAMKDSIVLPCFP